MLPFVCMCVDEAFFYDCCHKDGLLLQDLTITSSGVVNDTSFLWGK